MRRAADRRDTTPTWSEAGFMNRPRIVSGPIETAAGVRGKIRRRKRPVAVFLDLFPERSEAIWPVQTTG
jgi:hypothetical protein